MNEYFIASVSYSEDEENIDWVFITREIDGVLHGLSLANRSRQIVILLVQCGRSLDWVVGNFDELGNRLVDGLAGGLLHRNGGLSDADKTVARQLAVACQARERLGSSSRGAYRGADLPGHITQLPGAHASVATGQH